jgi:hypothetical protein
VKGKKMSSSDNLARNTSGIVYYPGTKAGFFAAGTFYMVWSLGVAVRAVVNMRPAWRKVFEQKVCRGRKIPFEGMYLSVLGYCAFLGQLGYADWKFYDSDNDNYINQNNLLTAIYFLGLGMAGTTMMLDQRYNLNHYFEQATLILPNLLYIVAMAFKSLQSMTTVDYIILVLQLVTYGAFVVALLIETFSKSAYAKFFRSVSLLWIAVWFYQTFTFYWANGNSIQEQSYGVDYVVNVFFVEMLIVTWLFSASAFLLTKEYDSLLADAKAAKQAQAGFKLAHEDEVSKSQDNVDLELLSSKPIA